MLQNYTILSQVSYVNIGGVRTFINDYQSFGDNTIFNTTHPSLQIKKKCFVRYLVRHINARSG